MSVQSRPRCFRCSEVVEYDPIFAAPCDHEECPSVVFHGLCLMEWREHRDALLEGLKRWVEEHS